MSNEGGWILAVMLAFAALVVCAMCARGQDTPTVESSPVVRPAPETGDTTVDAVEIVAEAHSGRILCVVKAGSDIGWMTREQTNIFCIVALRDPRRLQWLHNQYAGAGKCRPNCPGLSAHIGAVKGFPLSYPAVLPLSPTPTRTQIVQRVSLATREARLQMITHEEITDETIAMERHDVGAVRVALPLATPIRR